MRTTQALNQNITCPLHVLHLLHFLTSNHQLTSFTTRCFVPRHHCQLGPATQIQNTETSYLKLYLICIYIYIFITIVSYSANWHPMPPQHLSPPKKSASLFKKSIWWSLLLDYCEIKIPHILAGPHGVKRKIAVQSHTSQNIKSPCVLRKEASQRVVILKATSFV